MIVLPHHPYRVLIVDDERRDWAVPMREALLDTARDSRVEHLAIDVAGDRFEAERCLAQHYHHLTSLDMRFPDRPGEVVALASGLSLARSTGFPKVLVYSQTLRLAAVSQQASDSISVLSLPVDLYAKLTGSDLDEEPGGVEVLSVASWAKRVVDSLVNDDLELDAAPYGKRLTVVGAYLRHGVDSLPPFLARHLQTLANCWQERSNDRVDAAICFIEATARLALAQSAVLCRAQGETVEPPSDEHMITCHNALKALQARLSSWNWSRYLTPEAIDAFQQARFERNEKGHTLTASNPQKHWAALRPSLQYAMDVAAYWVRHPLAIDLRYSRDGWSAELLAGTASPRRRHLLPSAMDYPGEAARSGVWQSAWRIKGDVEPERVPLSWDGWLKPDPHSSTPWWFPAYRDKHGRTVCIDLDSGNAR